MGHCPFPAGEGLLDGGFAVERAQHLDGELLHIGLVDGELVEKAREQAAGVGLADM